MMIISCLNSIKLTLTRSRGVGEDCCLSKRNTICYLKIIAYQLIKNLRNHLYVENEGNIHGWKSGLGWSEDFLMNLII